MFSLGQAAPHLDSVSRARGAAFSLWEIIDTVKAKSSSFKNIRSRETTKPILFQPSTINAENPNAVVKKDFVANIEFKNVNFVYPARNEVQVLNGLSFTADSSATTALVGTSGCGKVCSA